MKKFVLSVVLSAACLPATTHAMPQSGGKNINIKNTEVVRVDDSTVTIAFDAEFGDLITAPNRSLVIIPSLSGNGGRSELPPIIVRGARALASAENQAMHAAGIDTDGRHITSIGKTLDYRVSIPWQSWMEGSQLVLRGLNTGRGRSTEVEIGTVASGLLLGGIPPAVPVPVTPPAHRTEPVANILAQPTHPRPYYPQTHAQPQVHAQAPPPPPMPPIATIGDELAARFPFVESVSKFEQASRNYRVDQAFDYNMPLVFGTHTTPVDEESERFVEMTRQGALEVKFDKGDLAINRNLGENNSRLVDLISAIRMLDNSPGTRIVHVIVAGFSAPEGDVDEKETLAMERAAVIRDFLTANSDIDPAIVGIFNGSVDWTSLRKLVSESNMSEKYKVLDIIDNTPAWSSTRSKGRMAQLMALNNGEEYRYIRELFFPKIRQTGAYVKIYYENVR